MPIHKTKTPKGNVRYRVQLCINGQRSSKSFDNHLEAAIWQADEEKILMGEISVEGRVTKNDMLLHEAMDRFIIESRVVVSRAQINNYQNSQKIISRYFKLTTKMSEIKHQDASAFVLHRMTTDRVGVSSIRNELSFIRGVYTKAVEWGVDIPSPELSIKRPRHAMRSREDRLDNIIKPHEITAIFTQTRKSRNNLYYYLKFLLYTGMRPSEATALYWNRLPAKEEKELIKRGLHIGFVDPGRGGFGKIGTKTERRFVPAHPKALEVIEQLEKTRDKKQSMVFLENKHINRDRAYKYYRRSMGTVTKNARIDGETLRGDIDFYSFRHTFRSRLEECGVSTAIAETIIGHSDRSFKFTYIHLSDDALKKAICLLEYPVDI